MSNFSDDKTERGFEIVELIIGIVTTIIAMIKNAFSKKTLIK